MANLDINFDEPKRTPPKSPAGISAFNRLQRYALMGFIVLGIVGFLVWLSDPLRDPTAGPKRNRSITIGGRAILQVAQGEGKQPTHFRLATSSENMEQYRTAVTGYDDIGVAEMVAAGKLVEVPSGTRVHVLENQGTTCRVRVLEGSHAKEALWVDHDILDGIE